MNNKDVLEIKQLYVDLCQASIDKDLNKIDSILANDYILIHITGMKQTKIDYINSICNKELEYYESKHESIDVSIYGNKAKVIARTKTLASPFGLPKSWWNLKQELEIEKIDGKWLIKKSIASMH